MGTRGHLLHLLLAPTLVFLQQAFPDDRGQCDALDLACIVGDASAAEDYPIRTVGLPIEAEVGELGTLNPGTDRLYLLPEGFYDRHQHFLGQGPS